VGNENLVRFLDQQQQLNERLAEQQTTQQLGSKCIA